MVRTLAVTFSPTTPSPRVAARTNFPFSYTRLQAKPSIFGSRTYSTSLPLGKPLRTRSSKARSSSALKALPKESNGVKCLTSVNSGFTLPPTRWVGESAGTSSGYSASISRRRIIKRSYSASVIVGASIT